MTLDALVEDPERIYSGNTYDLAVDYSDPLEPTVMVYRRDGQELMMIFNQPPGLCWTFPRTLDSFLHDPSLVDLVAEDIVDYLNNELIYAIEEGPPEFEVFEPSSPTLYEQLSLFSSSMLSEKKPVEEDPAYSVDHHWNTYENRRYCFFK